MPDIPASEIPVSVVIVTKNEEKRIGACLDALQGFSDIWVVDSASGDETRDIAARRGAMVVDYVWNNRYPKKRGWCLDYLELKHDWVLFVDADELCSEDLIAEIAAFDLGADEKHAGFFVRSSYMWKGRLLRHGLKNNKLCLLHKKRAEFPVIDDLGLPGMGEIEGHYQPVLKAGCENLKFGQLKSEMRHDAENGWTMRHMRYAAWEAGMNKRGSWPQDPAWAREMLKRIFRRIPFRGFAAFLHSYMFKLGFLDGAAGYDFAKSRAQYYRMISDASKDLEQFS